MNFVVIMSINCNLKSCVHKHAVYSDPCGIKRVVPTGGAEFNSSVFFERLVCTICRGGGKCLC